MLRVAACTFAALGLLGACSLYGGLDGLSSSEDPRDASTGGDSDVAPIADAAPQPPSDGSVDATRPANEAGVDAGYCAAYANEDVCSDFDDAMPLAAWAEEQTGIADVALVATGALSAPNAVRAAAGASGADRWAFFKQTFGNAPVGHARLSYALFVEARPNGNEVEVNGLQFRATKNSEFYLAITPTTAYIVEQSANADGSNFQTNYHPLDDKIPTGLWLRITLEVSMSAATKELSFAVDGVEVTRKTLTLSAPGTPRIAAGLTWVQAASANAVVLIDDLRFDVLP